MRRFCLSFLALSLTTGLAIGCAGDDSDDSDDAAANTGDDSGDDPLDETADDAGDESADETAGMPMTVDEAAVLEAANAFATTMDKVSDEPRTSQHALADTVNFYVPAEHRELYLSIDPDAPTEATFPEGTLLVKENLDAEGNSDGYFAMYKGFQGYDPEGNDWYWLRVDGAGATGNAGKVGFCKDCHGGGSAAVSDFVFGVPLDNRLQ